MNEVCTYIVENELGTCLENEPLYKHTSFCVGGKCIAVFMPKDLKSLQVFLKYIKEHNIPFKIFGKGSNLLVSDEFYNGVIIKLVKGFNQLYVDNLNVHVGAGYPLITLAYKMVEHELTGLEFVSGIPGTVGGAVKMNSGAYGSSISDVLVRGLFINTKGETFWVDHKHMKFNYRKSILHYKDWICLKAVFKLNKSKKDKILDLIEDRRQRRNKTQPVRYPSAGSVFRNFDNTYAWKLIDAVGLRGYNIGGAKISDIHANYIISTGGCKASDIKSLIEYVMYKVEKEFRIKLIPEVELFNW